MTDLRPEWLRRDVATGWRFSYEHHMVGARNPAGGQFTVFGDLKYMPSHMQPEKRDELGEAIAAWLNGPPEGVASE